MKKIILFLLIFLAPGAFAMQDENEPKQSFLESFRALNKGKQEVSLKEYSDAFEKLERIFKKIVHKPKDPEQLEKLHQKYLRAEKYCNNIYCPDAERPRRR